MTWVAKVTNWFAFAFDRAGLSFAPGAACDDPLLLYEAILAIAGNKLPAILNLQLITASGAITSRPSGARSALADRMGSRRCSGLQRGIEHAQRRPAVAAEAGSSSSSAVACSYPRRALSEPAGRQSATTNGAAGNTGRYDNTWLLKRASGARLRRP